ncbi:MAG: murein hydrolase activator EnvC family protein [Bdellovibrionota bacterium]|jgi:murein DD-endopeptidase MepM/ murein hydrolase activator NlpD
MTSVDNSQTNERPQKSRRRPLRILIIVLICFGLLSVPAFFGWKWLYTTFLEVTPPTIKVIGEIPHGIGARPVTFRWNISDEGAGLFEAKISLIQKGSKRDIFNGTLSVGSKKLHSKNIEVTFNAQESELNEGSVQLVIKAFDKSLWFNSAEQSYDLIVDYKKPKLAVVSTQHNAVHGGSQLIFYTATDENLALSGVKVGDRIFNGFNASFLDLDFEQSPNLYVCIYAIDLTTEISKQTPTLFAEDRVGNVKSMNFYNKIAPIRYASLRNQVPEQFLQKTIPDLIKKGLNKLEPLSPTLRDEDTWNDPSNSTTQKIQNFELVNKELRRLDREEILSQLRTGGRSEKLWQGAFVKPLGPARTEFGHTLNYIYNGSNIGTVKQLGFNFLSDAQNGEVRTINSGIVHFTGNIGTYGNVVVIDHGLGLFSLYSNLRNYVVKLGDTVQAGQTIGTIGDSGFALTNGFTVELWVNNIPANPREWWDPTWYKAHVIDKISAVKSALGIASTVQQF